MAGAVFKVTVIQHWLENAWVGADGVPCKKGEPGARFVERRRVKPNTPGAKKVKSKSSKWYGRLPGKAAPVPLSANKVAANRMLMELLDKAEMNRRGIGDPFDAWREHPPRQAPGGLPPRTACSRQRSAIYGTGVRPTRVPLFRV